MVDAIDDGLLVVSRRCSGTFSLSLFDGQLKGAPVGGEPRQVVVRDVANLEVHLAGPASLVCSVDAVLQQLADNWLGIAVEVR